MQWQANLSGGGSNDSNSHLRQAGHPYDITPTFQSNIMMNLSCISNYYYLPFVFRKVLNIISEGGVKGIAHIAVGGFHNMRQMFPEGLGATIYKDAWEVPAIFKWIQEVICNRLLIRNFFYVS